MHLPVLLLSCSLSIAFAQEKALSSPPPSPVAPVADIKAPSLGKPRVRLETSYGPILLELEPTLAPRTVENFLSYVNAGHYAGTVFHRVIPGFMIQGGGFKEDLTEKPAGPMIRNEGRVAQQAGLRNLRGTVAMARQDDPHSASAQFFINTVDNASLDTNLDDPNHFGYTVFGRVVEGMEAVDRIEKVQTVWRRGMQNVPEYAVRIKKAVLLP